MRNDLDFATKWLSCRRSALFLLLILGGCGGGGGSTQSGLTPPPSTPVAITSFNAVQVSAAAMEPASGGSDTLGAISAAQTPTATPAPRVLARALHRISSSASKLPSGPQPAAGVAQTINCAVSGSVTIDASGTSATVTFNACSDIAGQSISGSATMSGIQGTPGTGTFSATFSVDITFTETGANSFRLVGSFSISQTCGISSCASTFTGNSLGVGEALATWFLTSFSIVETPNGADIDISVSFTVSSTVLNGAVNVSTQTPLKIVGGGLYPSSGVLLITGAANSKVRVTVLGANPTSANQIQIELDENGDNIYEATTPHSWSDLPSL
jgi:hypothetical protein